MISNYVYLIDKFSKKIWKKEISIRNFHKIKLETIDDENISDMKALIKSTDLSNKELKRMLVTSEGLKKENDSSILFSQLAIIVSMVFSANSLIWAMVSIADKKTDTHIIPVAIILMIVLIIGLLGFMYRILKRNYEMRNNMVKINCIQISLRELLNDAKTEINNEEESYNHFKKELQDFENQNKKLINITRKIERNQNKKGLIDILFGK